MCETCLWSWFCAVLCLDTYKEARVTSPANPSTLFGIVSPAPNPIPCEASNHGEV